METNEFSRSIEIPATKAREIPEFVGSWWKEIARQANSKTSPGKIYAIGNYAVELAKNALSDGKSDGKISAYFDEERIKIIIEAYSSQEREMNLNIGGNYGLKEIIDYADDFVIEAAGKRYEKANTRELLEEQGDTNLRVGSKITFLKFIVAPPAQEADEDDRFARSRW